MRRRSRSCDADSALAYNVAEIRSICEDLYRPFWEINPVHQDPRHSDFAFAAADTARRFVADAFALERLIEGKDRGDDWAREAARLLEVARTIDLGIPQGHFIVCPLTDAM